MTNELARRVAVDISADNVVWARLLGTTDVKDQDDLTEDDATEYDNDGFGTTEVTLHNWSLTTVFNRKSNAGVFDPVQEIIRAARFKFGDAARVYVRWYDRNGKPDAKKGKALVNWNATATGVANIEKVTVTFKGDGVLSDIANPGNSTAPVLLSAKPSGAAAAQLVTIGGQYLTGATAVTFGGVAAADYEVVSDTTIVASLPAGAAGSAPIVVTTAAGTSNSLAYTRA